jgi:hypothetical protein
MKTWTTETWLEGTPEEVLAILTDPASISRWAPLSYELLELDGERLEAGSRARVRGALSGCPLEFAVHVDQAHDGRLALLAEGPVSIDAEYLLAPVPGGSRLRASVRVGGRGVVGRVLARAADALLATGLLRLSVSGLARELRSTVQR